MQQVPQSPTHQPALPTILSASRKRRTNQSTPSHPTPHAPILHQEKMIDARKYQLQAPNSQGIRSHIDTCLKAIASNYPKGAEREKSKTVHRVDPHLIKEYLNQLQFEYSLNDPFGPNPNERPKRTNIHSTPQPEQAERGRSRRKTYISMTVSGGQARQASTDKGVSGNKTQHPTQRTYLPSPSPAPRQALPQKIAQQFRYCLSCMEPILTYNIPHHEQHECTDLSALYKCSYQQLGQLVLDKIALLKASIKDNIARLKAVSEEWGEGGKGIQGEILTGMQQCAVSETTSEMANSPSENEKQPKNYQEYRNTINKIFLESMELTQKVAWFTQVYTQLQQQKGNLSVSQFVIQQQTPPPKDASPSPSKGSQKAEEYEIHDILRPVSHFQPNPSDSGHS